MTCPAQVASGGLPAVNGTRLTFVYDGLSRRIEKRVETQAPGSSTWTMVDREGFVYDGWNVVMSVRLNASGTVLGRIASYVWGPDVGSSWFARADWQRAGGVGGLLMILDGVSTPRSDGSNSPADPSDDDYFPLMDRLGNVTGYRKAANNTAYNDLSLHGAVYEYDAFGRELRSSGPVADWAPFHFSTKFTDAETGLNYYGYRYYDAAKGRWLSRDPIGEHGGANLCLFLANGATVQYDILGKEPSPINIGAYDYAGNDDQKKMFSHQHTTLQKPSQPLQFSNSADLDAQLRQLKATKGCCVRVLNVQGHGDVVEGGLMLTGADGGREILKGADAGRNLGDKLRPSLCKNCQINLQGCSAGLDEEFIKALAAASGCDVLSTKAPNLTQGLESTFERVTTWKFITSSSSNIFHCDPSGKISEIANSESVPGRWPDLRNPEDRSKFKLPPL